MNLGMLLSLLILIGSAFGTVDDSYPLTYYQAKGTHNSYHLKKKVRFHYSHNYEHPTLTDQLENYGIRQLELDIHLHRKGYFEVFHFPFFDNKSHCKLFTDCLK